MEIKEIISKQTEFFGSGMTRPYAFRKRMLDKLKDGIEAYEGRLFRALEEDLNKHRNEAYMTEIGIALDELHYCRNRLRGWMRDKYTVPTIAQLPAICLKSPEPYGKVLIVSPWNYPVLLTLEPLIGAIAAGNCAVIKPSAYTPSASQVIADMIGEIFPENYVAVVQGGREENKTLFEQDFDYIFFTGSVAVGKTVMEAASAHLSPVTLELGGKSPVIVDETADINIAAKRIAFGKIVNAGQTCVEPDYLLIQESVRDEFISAFRDVMKKFFPDGDYMDMACIVNDKHFRRVTGLMEGQKIAFGGGSDPETRFIEPTLLIDVDPGSPVMQEEIFGPLLPVLTYEKLGEAIDFVNSRPKPLALYFFSGDRSAQKVVMDRCSFGGGCINDVIMHLASSRMPFGGVGASGMGSYHGKKSFETFSHTRSIMKNTELIDVPLRYMPYDDLSYKLLRLIFNKKM
jgi:NAD-dependent aldehyde dehydrogenases